jgi:Mn2+/Fe2+ NRAMP family transporter
MGRHVNGPAHNVLAWGTILVVIALTAALLVMTLLGVG